MKTPEKIKQTRLTRASQKSRTQPWHGATNQQIHDLFKAGFRIRSDSRGLRVLGEVVR